MAPCASRDASKRGDREGQRTMDVVCIEHIDKTYPGVEVSLRGTKLEWKGPALWARNIVRAARLTSSMAPPVVALRDCSLTVLEGEILGLVGPNGSGKTTLMKVLAGLIRPTNGRGQVAGESLESPYAIRRKVSYVSTTGWMGLEWALTAEENIRFFAALCGMPGPLARCRAEEAVRAVDLWEDRRKYPSQLSNGMRQKVILARALLFHTPLLLLDEPTVGLDPLTVRTTLALLRQLCAERGQTIVLTDHQAAEMEEVADHIAVLAHGEIVLRGTPADLRGRFRDVTVIDVRTEEMEPPTSPPPDGVLAVDSVARPGALQSRVWRVCAQKSPRALEHVLAWLVRPEGRVVLLAENEPTLRDVLMLSRAGLAASGPAEVEVARAPKTRAAADGSAADPAASNFQGTP